jgi:hypothetical protein
LKVSGIAISLETVGCHTKRSAKFGVLAGSFVNLTTSSEKRKERRHPLNEERAFAEASSKPIPVGDYPLVFFRLFF